MEPIEKTYEKQDSIEVSRNQKGVYSFKQKRYFDTGSEDVETVINEMRKTEEMLLKAFSGNNDKPSEK